MRTRRNLLTAGVSLLATSSAIVIADENKQVPRAKANSIPDSLELIGELGQPLCTLVEFSGTWVGFQSKTLIAPRHSLQIDIVNGQRLIIPVVFPVDLVSLLGQTTGVWDREILDFIEDGDSWNGLCYECGKIHWIPKEVFDLPNVVPWNSSYPRKLLTEIVCVRVDLANLRARKSSKE